MTQEEKARAYDEALTTAKRIISKNCSEVEKLCLKCIFPTLAESEDERIRKDLIGGLMWQRDNLERSGKHDDSLILPGFCRTVGEHLAYLKKQKEYELTEEDKKIIPEALVMLCDDIINHRVHTPIKTDEEGARKIKAFLKTFNRRPYKTREEWEKQKEQKPADLPAGFYVTFPDGKKYYTKEMRCNGMNVKVVEPKPAEWSEEDEKILNELLDYCNTENATWYNWLKSLRPQPHWKPSKEEIDAFENLLKGEFPNKIFPGTTLANLLNKLKKLYYNESIQVWKPSEEQMEAFKDYIEDFQAKAEAAVGGWNNFDVMIQLYEQLKKL